MTMGYIKFFFKKHLEKLISAMVLTARKTTTRTHKGRRLLGDHIGVHHSWICPFFFQPFHLQWLPPLILRIKTSPRSLTYAHVRKTALKNGICYLNIYIVDLTNEYFLVKFRYVHTNMIQSLYINSSA